MALKDIKGRTITVPVYIPTSQGEIDLQTAGGDVDLSSLALKVDVGDKTQLLTTDKDNLVKALNELFQSASNGKAGIRSAIAGKQWGGSIPASPTYQQIIDTINAVIDRNGDNTSIGNTVSGTTLKLTPPAGHYDGSADKVTITDADFIAGNIKSGVDLFGVVGTLPSGCQYIKTSYSLSGTKGSTVYTKVINHNLGKKLLFAFDYNGYLVSPQSYLWYFRNIHNLPNIGNDSLQQTNGGATSYGTHRFQTGANKDDLNNVYIDISDSNGSGAYTWSGDVLLVFEP